MARKGSKSGVGRRSKASTVGKKATKAAAAVRRSGVGRKGATRRTGTAANR